MTAGDPTVDKALIYEHVPVLLDEVIRALVGEATQAQRNGAFVDATFGRGGHSQQLLERLGPEAKLLALDRDIAAFKVASRLAETDSRVVPCQSSLAELSDTLARFGFVPVQGVLMDLGVSSPQLDDPDRGFSFRHHGPLDMRMDLQQSMSAASWLNEAREADIADVIYQLGEDRFARRIARQIVAARPLQTTTDLSQAVLKAVPAKGWKNGRTGAGKHPATQTFQAVRMFINSELDQIEAGLTQAFDALADGGRLAVISFHSLEDRVVKQHFKKLTQPPALPRRLPVRADAAGKVPAKLIGRAVKPGVAELDTNPRARSATLRVVEKLAVA
ncbi:MAG: 16S rRNA (cytosine(1402)-N(4))-methyltransferase RsmH [Pseudomonadota bacterium]